MGGGEEKARKKNGNRNREGKKKTPDYTTNTSLLRTGSKKNNLFPAT